jgi:pilus assembly protein Flp/PilA
MLNGEKLMWGIEQYGPQTIQRFAARSQLLKLQNEWRLKAMERLLKFLKDDKGASAVEYGLLVAMIAAVIVGAVTLIGANLQTTFNYVASIVLKP